MYTCCAASRPLASLTWLLCTRQVGTGNASVAEEVAEVQRVLQASGLKYTLHSAGTTIGRYNTQMNGQGEGGGRGGSMKQT